MSARRGIAAAMLTLALAGCSKPIAGPKLAALYGETELLYRSDDRFRTDYDPLDAPFDAETLERNFLKLAFNSEPQVIGKETIIEGEAVQLLRWPSDVRYATVGLFPADTDHIDALATRIGEVIGRTILPVGEYDDAEIRIWMLDERDRDLLRRELLDRFGPSVGPFIKAWTERPELPCIGTISTDPKDDSLVYGLIFIKSELSGAFRRACLTEEFAQVFGLINDDPDARPSIFNDDQEFIELTRHDEYLLEMLYDPRLRSGMTEAEARPLVRRIVREFEGLDTGAAL